MLYVTNLCNILKILSWSAIKNVVLVKKELLFILAILAVVAVSACVSSTNTQLDNGLVVNQFSADPSSVDAEDTVSFLLDVENVGGTTASCVVSELFGIDGWRTIEGLPLSSYGFVGGRGLTFSYIDGSFNMCYSDINTGAASNLACFTYVKDQGVSFASFVTGAFRGFAGQFCNSFVSADQRLRLVQFAQQLDPPLPERNKPGQPMIRTWLLRPPLLPEGVTSDYTILARTSFFYESNAHLNLEAWSRQEEKTRLDQGRPVTLPVVVDNSEGPIQIIVASARNPIVVNPQSYSGPLQFENVRFDFVNVGNGFPLSTSGVELPGYSPTTERGFIFATISVSGPGVFFSDCLGQSGNEIFITGDVVSNLVRLRGSTQSVPIACEIAIDRSQFATTPVASISFDINLFYRYYVDAETLVHVRGVEGLPGSAVVRYG